MTNENTMRRGRILEAAREKFFQSGFSRVTTQEIASDLGISKKTLYSLFPTKNALLRAVILMTREEMSGTVRSLINDEDTDFIEKLTRLLRFLAVRLSRFSGPFLQDLRRSAPDLWKDIERFRREQIFANFSNLIREGTRKGAFRRDVSPHLMVLMFLNLVQTLINPEVLSDLPFSASDVFESITKVSLEGILTDKGRARYLSRRVKHGT